MTLSIVLPVFNEQDNIPAVYSRIIENLKEFDLIAEFLFVNDGSTDGSYQVLKDLAAKDANVKYINLSRNFGHQAALTAGLDYATGDAIITMDCDLQDPPEVLPEMISKWIEGYKIVYTRRKERKDKFFKRITAKFYYHLLYKFSEIKIPAEIGDFRLLDRKVLNELNKMREKSRYLRGMVPWMGYNFAIIDYDRPLRNQGETGFSFLKMFRLGMNGILSFSMAPLRLGLLMGFLIVLTGFAFLIYLFINFFVYHQFYKLLEWMAVVNYILIGFLFILIWIIAEYIGKIFNESKNRPVYLINDTGNIGNIDETVEIK
jgi:polyisoprenyl-phosphate glycosyltransferase